MESPGGPDESFEESPFLISEEDFSILDKGHGKEDSSLVGSLESAWNVLRSGVLIPDSLKGNPYTRPIMILVAALFIVLPVKIYVLILLIGLIAGVVLNPAFDKASPTVAAYKRKFDQIDAISFDLPKSPSSSAVPSSSAARLSLSPKIDATLDVFLDRLVTSLIDPWFMNQNKSGQREFQSCVRSTLDAALANLRTTVGGLGKDSTTLFIYGLTNALNIHMQEYKAFCKTGKTSKEFLLSPEALRTFYSSTQAEVSHFRQIVSVLLKKLLPRQEAKSIVVVSLLKEVIASGALWNAMDRLCDPDFINMKIVDALKEPTDLSTKLEPGWSLVILKGTYCTMLGLALIFFVVIKGKDLPMDGADGGMYCLIHIAGRKVRTRRISNSDSPVWNESFQFKVSDQVLKHLKLHVQLLKYSYVGQDTNCGYAKVDPEIVKGPEGAKQSWLKFKSGELFVESYIMTTDGKQQRPTAHEHNDSNVSLPQFEVKARESAREDVTIDEVLGNNEIFMEFYEFLNEFKAPPYLQFFMNYDAFRQFAAMELGVDPTVPEAIDNYFKYTALTSNQREQLKMIKMDALDLFNRHFLNNEASKYFIDISEDLLSRLQRDLKSSDRLTEDGHYAGTGQIGPNTFLPIYNWMYGVLKEVYLEKFKASPRFQRYCERSQYSMSKFTFEEDQASVLSAGNTLVSQSKKTINGDFDEDALFDVEEGGTACDDSEMDIKKISTAISILKQQLASIEDKLESGSDSSTKLLKSKKDIEQQVASMINLIRAKESSMANDSEDFWLDLRNVSIKVRPSTHGNDSTSSLWSSNPVYDVEVVREIDESSGPLVLSVVSKAFSDFEALHRALKKEFPKLAKIDPPTPSDSSELLERYLLLLISDEFIRQSPVLREFVSLDGDLEAKTLTSSASNLVEAVAGKKVKNALQTATSILSLGMIGSGSASSKAKRSHFYETREHHTTSELLGREAAVDSESSLNRSRSISSLVQEETNGKEKPMCPPFNKSMPPTPVKSSAKLDAASTPKASKLALDAEPKSAQIFSVEEFTEAEIDMLMETVYAFVTETFDLREPNQWIRRKVLSVSKQLLKQAYGDTLSKTMSRTLNGSLTEDGVVKAIEALTRLLWPNGIFIKDVPPPNRSPDQQLATQIEARALFLNKIPDAIEKMAGHYNAVNGMTRIFNMIQEKDFNKLLFLTFIDITTKILFTEQAS